MGLPDSTTITAAALSGRRLLDHPFYRRWEQGSVSMAELTAYAAQYRHFENFLPGFLQRLAANLPAGTARELIAANLADEEGDPVAHVELFERFAEAVGASPEPASTATSKLLATYEDLLAAGPGAALGCFVAYESQASDVARRKAYGLRHHYGLDDHAVSFWVHHAAVDARHGEWAQQALDQFTDSPDGEIAAIRRAGDAWWAFLDEREALSRAS